MIRKIVAVWVSLAMLFGFVVIVDIVTDFTPTVKATTLYVNETGSGGAYTSIQDAINAAQPGDTVYVYSGTYFEHVIVDKTLNLTGENLNTTVINGSDTGDVIFVSADWVNITGFTVTDSGYTSVDGGIELNNVQNCKVFNNRLLFHSWYGIYLDSSSNNIITNNIGMNNDRTINLLSSSYNKILANNLTQNDYISIHLRSSSNNLIKDNNIYNNYGGIALIESSYNDVIDNIITSNSDCGVFFYNSHHIYFTGNNFTNDGMAMRGNQLIHYNTHTIPINNTVNGKPLYYYKDVSGINIDGIQVGQLFFANCEDIDVRNLKINNTDMGFLIAYSSGVFMKGNNVSSSMHGLYLDYSSSCHITDNIFSWNTGSGIWQRDSLNNDIIGNKMYSNDGLGINLWYSEGNNFTNNDILNNYGGIYIAYSSGNNISKNNFSYNGEGFIIHSASSTNKIYHNNILMNTNQVTDNSGSTYWDNGYPLGGNYWSDYIGVDNFKGPNQNIPGRDGIGDSPYVIDADSQDNYPLMEPYKPLENYTILKQGWNLISIPLIQIEQNLTRVLGTIDGWNDAVQFYDRTDVNDPWKHHKVGKPYGNDLSELNETMGFWVHVIQLGDTIFLYNGTQPSSNQTIPLHPGWNMVGYPSLTSYNRTEGLNNLTFDNQVDAIWSYDAATQKWEEMGESDYFEIGKGYYIHAKSECEWEVPL